jgi:serine/threonine-protein kinase HipA
MPLAAKEHPHGAIEPFLWGLLPDNEVVLTRWAQRFHVSPRNVFALISEVGEDCAGAVQFVRPERRDAVLGPSASQTAWLTESEVASRLRILRSDASAGRAPGDSGQFSLAGAQPKTALLFDGQRWGIPSGREPTTHILKPQLAELDGHAANEHLCLKLAGAMGLPAVQSEVRQFEDVTAIVVTRYDRVPVAELASARAALAATEAAEVAIHAARGASGDPSSVALAVRAAAEAAEAADSARVLATLAKSTLIYRIHQEDICQALGVHPAQKYQNEGGPGPKQIIDLLRGHLPGSQPSRHQNAAPFPKDEDVATFLDALILNWLIGGTDAHAKNYSLLLGAGGLVRLAPLYDIASILAFPGSDPHKAKMAMKIGDRYGLMSIGLPQWRKLAASIGMGEDALAHRIRAMATELPDRLADEIRTLTDTGLSHPVVDTLGTVLSRRARAIAKA